MPPATPTAMAEPDPFLEAFGDSERELLERLEFAVCVGRFYGDLAERLLNGAAEGFDLGGVSEASVHTFRVPGAFELPFRGGEQTRHWGSG